MIFTFQFLVTEEDHGIMMAHYLMLMGVVNECMFLCIAGLFDHRKLIKYDLIAVSGQKSNAEDLPSKLSTTVVYLIFPVGLWLCIKFRYHFALSLLCMMANNATETIAYSYNILRPGKLVCNPEFSDVFRDENVFTFRSNRHPIFRPMEDYHIHTSFGWPSDEPNS